jgi:hypothetical protein
VIADTAYDSDPSRQRLKKRGIELMAPCRENNRHRRYEDGRKLRRYKRRWIVEPTNSWLGQFRRLLVRHELMNICSPLIALSSKLPASGLRLDTVYEIRSTELASGGISHPRFGQNTGSERFDVPRVESCKLTHGFGPSQPRQPDP